MKQPIIVLILLTLFLTSCERIVHEPEISIGVIENQEKLIEAAEGCWAKFIWAINYPDRSSYYYQNLKADDVTILPCGYISFYQNKTDCWYSTSADFTNYNQYSDYLYESLYLVIASVNNIISKFTDPAKEDQLTQEIIGEMLFLRAYCHFRLVRTYGQVPIVRDIEVKYNLNKPDFLQIYAFIESDLKQTLSLLPLTSEASRIPGKRPTQAAAKTLLAEVYLHWAGYPIKDAEKYLFAAREAGELIENADYYGVGLMDDFAFLWDAEHSQNMESLFTLYFSDLDKVNSVDEINLMYMKKEPKPHYLYVHPWYMDYNNSTFYSGEMEPSFFASELYFFNHFPRGYRKNITFFMKIYVPAQYFERYGADTGYITIDTLSLCERAGYRKFYYEESLHAGGVDLTKIDTSQTINFSEEYIGDNKIYIYRYAHTLLIYAEAKARSGQLDLSAYEAVNQIRRRANHVDLFSPSVFDLAPGLSNEDFADSVVWERAWELAGEPEGRYFDLLRLERLEDLQNYRHPFENIPPLKPITHDEYFVPIPEEDVILNPNLE